MMQKASKYKQHYSEVRRDALQPHTALTPVRLIKYCQYSSTASRKHAYIILTPLNPTFIS